ncbi:MAG: hypothetical protein LBR52_06475 [Prevotellaceae bacterium]|jgi:hypothetical protein|nr:hypothetical protein [Prevotellaceae bacterium]
MKTLKLIIIELVCLFSAAYGQEYKPQMLTYDDWLHIDDTQQPFEEEYQFQAFQERAILADFLAYNLDDEMELGGVTREVVGIGDGIPFLLLLSFGFCLKRYRFLSKNKNVFDKQ